MQSNISSAHVLRIYYSYNPSSSLSPQIQQNHHSSHSSFFAPPPLPPPIPPAFFLIALVPTALFPLPPIKLCPCCLCAPASAKLSQKSFLLSSIGTSLYPAVGFALVPSTKRLKPSAALFAPVCAPRATTPAVRRAWAARSVSASLRGGRGVSFLQSMRGKIKGEERPKGRYKGSIGKRTYLSSSRLNPPLIHTLRRLPNRSCKPPEPLTQRSHRVLLQIIQSRQAHLSPRRFHRLTPEPCVFAALGGMQVLWSRSIRGAEPGEVSIVYLGFASRRHRGSGSGGWVPALRGLGARSL
jgi:hypothetical protein